MSTLMPWILGGIVLRVVREHVRSSQVSRVIYGAIIGLALVEALEDEYPHSARAMVETLLGTAIAVALADSFSDLVGGEMRSAGPITMGRASAAARRATAVAFGICFPAIFFLLSAAGVFDLSTAFNVATWSGVALIGIYGFVGARLGGAGIAVAVLQALAIAIVGAMLIALKVLVH
jgi:VIT1/CCC1 family predicted Fe2+/Mn2+ transporter